MLLNEDTKQAVIERKDQATGSLWVVVKRSWDRGWSVCLGCAFVSLLSVVTACLHPVSLLGIKDSESCPAPTSQLLFPPMGSTRHSGTWEYFNPGWGLLPAGARDPRETLTPYPPYRGSCLSKAPAGQTPLGLHMVGVRAAPPNLRASSYCFLAPLISVQCVIFYDRSYIRHNQIYGSCIL